MKKSIFLLCFVAVISFIAGFVLCHVRGQIARTHRANEYRRIEELKKEASSFFYKTMRELYEGTYNPEDGYVVKDIQESFEKYKLKLEPKCRLAYVDEAYGSFFGDVYFPSENVFDVIIKKIDNEWKLTYFKGRDSKSFWHNLQSNQYKEQDIPISLTKIMLSIRKSISQRQQFK